MTCSSSQNGLENGLLMYVHEFIREALLTRPAYQVDDPRLDCAIFRPMKTEHDSFLAYYLTQDDDSALTFKDTRAALPPYEIPEDQQVGTAGDVFLVAHCGWQETVFHFVRDYETVKVEQEVPNEFLLVLHDGEPPGKIEDDERPGHPPREKGAYYKTIERKMQLKKKRANVRSIIFQCVKDSCRLAAI